MRQVLQRIDSGATQVCDVPAPVCAPGELVIANEASLVSAGTEKMLVDLAKRSLLGKARERPDQVRRVLQKLRDEGVVETVRQVRARLADPLALGYSAAGVVLEVGRDVTAFRAGDRVASNGPHAEVVAVPELLCARIPDGLAAADACYAVVGAIALQGVRLARVGLGDRVAVIGLGLVGQLAVMLLRAAGCRVVATDPDPARQARAAALGAEVGGPAELLAIVAERTGGHGVDAVLITASTPSNDPLALAAQAARRKARLVAVGAVGLEVPRREFYPKELELVVSCSYGPGRYDARYEERGHDYPYAYVRWTEQRNIAALLELMAAGRLPVGDLTTHRVPIGEAERAYALLDGGAEPYLGIVLQYPPWGGELAARRRVALPAPARAPEPGALGLGFLGAGAFAGAVLLPALARRPDVRPRAICSAGGVRAAARGERYGFELACTDAAELFADEAVRAVVVATRHDQHAAQGLAALRAGKHVFIEKPLAIDAEELARFAAGVAALGPRAPLWTVGFNRRFSPAARRVAEHFATVRAPRTLTYRFNAGAIPADHWTQDPAVGGGRLLGEACHALDLAAFLVGSRIVRVFCEAVAPGGSAGAGDDQAIVVARFEDGSIGTIGYFAGGDRALPKERVELFGGGRAAVIDDFKAVTLAAGGKAREQRLGARDKGHAAELDAFVAAVRAGGPPPIPYEALLTTSAAALAAVESLRSGAPVDVRAP